MTFAQACNVFKLRIGVLIALTALAGYAVTPGRVLDAWQIAVLGLAVLLSSAAAGGFNQYFERDLDARMARTRARPFVSGALHAGRGWLVVLGVMLAVSVGAAAWLFNTAAALYVFLGAYFYAIVYTVWLKRRTHWNIVIGGLSGSFAVLAGAAAADPLIGPVGALLALVLFLWTPPHFWSLAIILHRDYAAADVPMLPVTVGDARAARIILAHTVALTVASVLPVFFGLGWIYLTGALVGGLYFIYRSAALARDPGLSTARHSFAASLLQLSLLLVGAIVDVGMA